MSVGFGFSVGDFIAVLRLVGTVIDVLRESSCATTSFRSLIAELYGLETALLRVKRLDPDDGHIIDITALRGVASQCQRTIDGFYQKIQKYQPHLQQRGTESKIKDTWMKVKWAFCKKDDLETFRAKIRGHTGSLEILLLSVSMESTKIQGRRQDEQQKSLGHRMQQFSYQIFKKLSAITDSIAQNIQQGRQLLESSAQIVQTNLRTFQVVRDIQLFVLKIPGQIQRQQPVYLIDPYNKESPFHLEFVRSAEALLAILKVNLKESGCGPDMINRGEFAIEEIGTQSIIDIAGSWDMCFYPGQRVAMSMIFKQRNPNAGRSLCPRCTTDHEESADKEITCITCGTVFRRIEEIHDNLQTTAQSFSNDGRRPEHMSRTRIHGPAEVPQKRKREEEDDGDDNTLVNLKKFRRIQLVSKSDAKIILKPVLEGKRLKLYELKNNDWFDRGIGFCTGVVVNGEARLHVQSEDRPARTILETKIMDVEGYQKQQDTLIVWTEANGTDMALSFQEPKGCEAIWNFINQAQLG